MQFGILADELYTQAFIARVNALAETSEAEEWIRENEMKNVPFLAVPVEEGFDVRSIANTSDIPQGSVLVLRLNGPVMPEGKWGMPGLADLRDMMTWAMGIDAIGSIVLQLETGGGSAYRLFQFCDSVIEMRERKPILMHLSGMSASAGVAIHVCGTEVYAEHASTAIGSIGVQVSHLDMIGYFEQMGCKYHQVVARTSPDKNKDVREMRGGIYDTLQDSLDAMHAEFKARVRAMRPKVSDAAMTGKMYQSADAQEHDLIDGIATLDQVVSRAYSLSLNLPKPKNPQYVS